MFLKSLPTGYGDWFGGEYKNVKDDNNVNVMFWNGRQNYFNGMYWYKDPTDYKMQYTIYWQTESFAHDYDNWINMTKEFGATGYGADNYDKYKYANMFLKSLPTGYGNWFGGEYKNVKDDNNVNVMFWNGRQNYFNGMYWYKDPTDYKMQYTIYWQTESFAHDYDNWINMTNEFEAAGNMIYQGLFADPQVVLGGSEGVAMT